MNIRSPTIPTSTRRSGPAKASSAATGSDRSSPRSPAKWFLVPDGTHTNGTSASTATAATTPSDPSPPATPTASAPSTTARRASAPGSSPSASRCTRTPRARAASTSPTRPALPSPDRGFTSNHGRLGFASASPGTPGPRSPGTPEPDPPWSGPPVGERSPPPERGSAVATGPATGPGGGPGDRRAWRAAVAYSRAPATMARAPAAWR